MTTDNAQSAPPIDVNATLEWLKTDGLEWLQTQGLEFGLNLIAALAIFFFGRMVVGWIVGAMKKAMQRADIDPTLERFIANLVRTALLVVVIIAAISALGIQTASFIAIFGAAGLAVGLALQGSLSNFAAGVLIVLFRPYRVGDWIEAAGISGSVQQVQILTTVLLTGDNKQIVVPNSQIMNSVITNFSAQENRRIDLVIGVSYDDDLDHVRRTLEELITADERILKEPACRIAVSELADSSVNFVVRPWCKTEDYWNVRFDLIEAIKKRFDEVDITFPYPQRDVHLHQVQT